MRGIDQSRPMPRRMLALAAVLLLGCSTERPVDHPEDVRALIAQSSPGGPAAFRPIGPNEGMPGLVAAPEPYRLGVGDVVNVSVPGEQPFIGLGETSTGELVGIRVKDDGHLYLPYVQRVPAAGRTVVEVQEDIRKRLESFIPDPFVSLDVLDYQSQKFYVLGEVNTPGAYSVNGRITLIEAIALGGGFHNGNADVDGAYVLRGGQMLPVSVADVVRRGDLRGNVRMRHNDILFVPHVRQRVVYVLGEVNQPQVVPIDPREGLTLAGAIATSGGINADNADMNVIRIFRGDWVHPRAYTVAAHELYAYGGSVTLKPGDRVLIAPTELASYGRAMKHVFPWLNQATSVAALGFSAAALANR